MLKQYKQIQGLTLLEMLIALVILSVGLIGVATLQMRGQQFNYFAYIRTQATFLAYDLIDRMRINNGGAYNGLYNEGEKIYPPDECPQEQKSCIGTPCDAAELATYDLAEWCQLLQTLPQGQALINFDADDKSYEIILFWAEDRDPEKIKQVYAKTTCGIRETRESCQSWTFSPSP